MSVTMDQRSDDGTNHSSHSVLSSMKNEMSILEELELKFGSAKNKSQIIHALEHSAILHRIPLPTPNATTEQARKDFRRERVLMNEVPFIPDKVDVDRCNAFSMTLKVLLDRMSRCSELYDAELYPNAEAITDAVMQRACRTGAGADSFFMVQKLLCIEGTFVTQRTFMTDSPIKIDVFVAEGSMEAPEHDSVRGSAKKVPLVPTPHGAHKHSHSLFTSSASSGGSSSAGIALHHSSGADPADADRPAPHAAQSSNGSSGTPPSTPPVGKVGSRAHSTHTHHQHHHHHHHHIGLPSPLKISLRNMGLMSSGKNSKPFSSSSQAQHLPNEEGGVGSPAPAGPGSSGASNLSNAGPVSSSGGHGVAFTPPGTPSASSGYSASHSFSFSSSSVDDSMHDSSHHLILRQAQQGGAPASTSSANIGGGAICARVQVMNSFAIYDVAAIEEITGEAGQDPDAWLEVEAIVVDESNFKTDQHSRKLQLIVTCPATGKIYTSAPDPSTAGRSSGRLSGRRVLQELTSWFTHLPQHHHFWRHHHDHHGHGRLHHSASDLSDQQITPPGSTRSTAAGQGTPSRSSHPLLDPVDSLLARGEAQIPIRQPDNGSYSQDTDSALYTATSSDNTVSVSSSQPSPTPLSEAVSPTAVVLDPSPLRRFSSHPAMVAQAQPGALHDAAVAALLEPSPASTDQFLSPDQSPGGPLTMKFSNPHMSLREGSQSAGSEANAGTDACSSTDAATDAGTAAGSELTSSCSEVETGTERTSGANGPALPVRTLGDLDLLIPALRLMEGRGSEDSGSSDAPATEHS